MAKKRGKKKAPKKSDKFWVNPDHTTHLLVLALMIVISVLFYGYFSAGGVLALGSILASAIILIHKHRHHLTTLGPITFSYFISAVLSVGIVSVLRKLNTPIESQIIICIIAVGAALYWLGTFHAPAVLFGVAYIGFSLGLINYIIAFLGTMFCFIMIRLVVYLVYDHLSLEHFVHEFIREEEKLFKRI
jgi:hypothetical protein